MSRQKRVLIILAVVFVLALIYAFWASPRPQKAATPAEPPAPRRPVAEKPAEVPAGETHVRLDLLTRERGRFAGYQRDIFNYPRLAPPPPPPQIAKPVTPPPPVEATEPAPVPPEVERELAKFTFLGFLEKGNVKTVFLSSGEEIFLVKKGQSFGEGNEFQVTSLTPEMLVIHHGEDPRAITIPLVEQEPLVPSGAIRPVQPFSRPGTNYGRAGEESGDLEYHEEVPEGGEEGLSPPQAEGENGLPPAGENGGMEPRSGGEGKREYDIFPPGGAANE